MAQVINTNVASLFAGAALNKSANALLTAQQRLSSGLRINSAKDDATGLGIATGYDTQIRAANVNIRIQNDAISTAQTKDGYLGQITENLQRVMEIVVQTPAGNAETTALLAENVRIATLAGTTAMTAIANATIGNVAADMTAVAGDRATQGAAMATAGSQVATLSIGVVNLSAAYSRIMDTDYAAESTAQSKNQILQQAGIAALAQANQNPAMVLSLLR